MRSLSRWWRKRRKRAAAARAACPFSMERGRRREADGHRPWRQRGRRSADSRSCCRPVRPFSASRSHLRPRCHCRCCWMNNRPSRAGNAAWTRRRPSAGSCCRCSRRCCCQRARRGSSYREEESGILQERCNLVDNQSCCDLRCQPIREGVCWRAALGARTRAGE